MAATIRNEAASASSAASIPAPATTTPAIAGPPAAPTVNATLSSALPSRSWPAGARVAAAAARVSARDAEASEPSIVARARTAIEHEVVDEQREDGEGDGLGGVQERQRDAHRQRLERAHQGRSEQRRREVHAAEQRRGRHRAAGLIEDEHREGDLAQPVAELVDEIGEAEVCEAR